MTTVLCRYPYNYPSAAMCKIMSSRQKNGIAGKKEVKNMRWKKGSWSGHLKVLKVNLV